MLTIIAYILWLRLTAHDQYFVYLLQKQIIIIVLQYIYTDPFPLNNNNNNNNNTHIAAIAPLPLSTHPRSWVELLAFGPKCKSPEYNYI